MTREDLQDFWNNVKVDLASSQHGNVALSAVYTFLMLLMFTPVKVPALVLGLTGLVVFLRDLTKES